MRRAPISYGIRLSHLLVRYGDGTEDRLPWTKLSCTRLNALRPSRALRDANPRLPAKLRLCGVLPNTLELLRTRAIVREIRDGAYNRYWLIDPPPSLGRIVSATAIAAAMVLGIVWLLYSANFIALSPTEWAEIEAVLGRSLAGWIAVSIALSAVFVLLERLYRRGARPLAMRTSSAGVEVQYDDGSSRFHDWQDVVPESTGERILRNLATGVQLPSPRPADQADWRRVRAAAARTLGVGERKTREALFKEARAFGWFWLAFVALTVLVCLLTIVARERSDGAAGIDRVDVTVLMGYVTFMLWPIVLAAAARAFHRRQRRKARQRAAARRSV